MKSIHLKKFLDLVEVQKRIGSLPSKIKMVVDHPSDLEDKSTVWIDRFHHLKSKSLGEYKTGLIVTDDDELYRTATGDGLTVLLVSDAEAAYWKFVRYYRNLFNIPVFAITGTCGKTTTKEMIKTIFSKHYRVQATIRSKNSGRFHLPYLLGIDEETDVAVFETGVAKPGDIIESCAYFRPNVGVITNIGVDHLNEFANYEAYVQEKATMLQAVSNTGTLIINGDDSNIMTIDFSKHLGRRLTFGFGEGVDFRATDLQAGKHGMEFKLVYQHLAHQLSVPGYGEHNVYNALAAIAASYAVGIGIDEAGMALKSYRHLQGHMNVMPGINGSLVIDDTWNSNPTSVQTAIQVLCDLANGRKKIAVLGRMAALGKFADREYERVSKRLVDAGIDVLVTKGSIARDFAKHAIKHGMRKESVFPCDDALEIQALLRSMTNKDTIVLVKTSMNDAQSLDLIKDLTAETLR